MLNNNSATNQPTIPVMLYDGTYSPWGYTQRPQPITQLNTNWSCPSGTPVISIAGSGRETVAFQIFITAPAATSLSDDTELRVVASRLAPSRPQAEIASDIPASLESLLASQGQNIRQRCELSDAIDLDQSLGFDILRLGQLFYETMIVLDLHRQRRNLSSTGPSACTNPGGRTSTHRFAKQSVEEAGNR
jgi:hypothetical protein